MGSQSTSAPTNERIVQLLEEVVAQLADARKREEQIATDLKRLLGQK